MPPQIGREPSELIPAIGYIRVSMLLEEQISPEIQKSAIQEWAHRRGRRIVRWISDLDVSGRTFARKIMAGIEAIEAGEAREIVVWKYSRFGRTRTGCAVNLGRINRAGGELQSATEEVDASTAVGKLTRGVLMELAAFESDRAGEQWVEAHANRRARGLPATGRPRFGYVLRGRAPDPLQKHRTVRAPEDGEERYEIDPVTGPALAETYRRYIAGAGAYSLAAHLNDAGFTTAFGRVWASDGLLDMLDSGFGAGLLRTHDPNCACPNRKYCKNRVYLDGAHPPVITQQEWEAYLRRRRRVANTAPRARVSVYPLSGRIRCGHCGGSMTITAEGSTPGARYACTNYRTQGVCGSRTARRLVLEDRLLQVLAGWVRDIESKPVEPIKDLPVVADAAVVEAEVAALDAALDRLTKQLAMGTVEEDSYKRVAGDLLQDRAKASARLDALRAPAPRLLHEYVGVMEELLAEWGTLPLGERREMVGELVAVVRVFRESRKVAWVEIVSTWGQATTVSF